MLEFARILTTGMVAALIGISHSAGATTLASEACVGRSTTSVQQHISSQVARHELWTSTFIQHNHIRALKHPLISTGEVFSDVENGLVWQVNTPLQSSVVLTNSGVDMGAGLMDSSKTIAALLIEIIGGDFGQLAENFELTGCIAPEYWQLDLNPRQAYLAERISQLSFSGQHWVSDLQITQAGGQVLQIRFTQPVAVEQLPYAIQKLLHVE